MKTVLEIYTVDAGASSSPNAERISYIRKQLLGDANSERFFDSTLDEVLVNLCAERVLTLLEKEKEAALARQSAENLLQQLTL